MPDKNDNFIELTVKSTSGVFADRYNRNNRAEKVYAEAIAHFGLSAAGTYVLRREADGRVLALSEKLVDLGLSDPDVLLLQANQAQDG